MKLLTKTERRGDNIEAVIGFLDDSARLACYEGSVYVAFNFADQFCLL